MAVSLLFINSNLQFIFFSINSAARCGFVTGGFRTHPCGYMVCMDS